MFALFLAMLAPLAHAEDCTYQQTIVGRMVINRFSAPTSLGCLVQVTPLEKPNLVYREYYFDERGRFLTLHSQAGDYETSTANHAYFLFPRHNLPNFHVLDNGTIVVTLASGQEVNLASDQAAITSFPATSISEPAGAGLAAQDFPVIQGYAGLSLDAGWRVGNYAYFVATAQSTFRDQSGHECAVSNTEIFDYRNNLYAEPTFLFENDAKLASFINRRCPTLHWKP